MNIAGYQEVFPVQGLSSGEPVPADLPPEAPIPREWVPGDVGYPPGAPYRKQEEQPKINIASGEDGGNLYHWIRDVQA